MVFKICLTRLSPRIEYTAGQKALSHHWIRTGFSIFESHNDNQIAQGTYTTLFVNSCLFQVENYNFFSANDFGISFDLIPTTADIFIRTFPAFQTYVFLFDGDKFHVLISGDYLHYH